MTLGEARAKALKLMDEYSSRGNRVTDRDLELKMNSLFDTAQKQVSQLKRIIRRYELPLEEGVREYPMPEDFGALRRVWADGEVKTVGRWFGPLLELPEGEKRKIAVEYYAYPADITDETPDDYIFEVARDAQECMPYWVAAQPCLADNFVVEYEDLMGMYDRMAALLDTRPPGGAAEVVRLGRLDDGWGWYGG